MVKKKLKYNKRKEKREKKAGWQSRLRLALPLEVKKKFWAILLFVSALILSLSFFEKAGLAGEALRTGLIFLIGRAVFILPLILVVAGLVFLYTKFQRYLNGVILAIFLLILGISALLECSKPGFDQGGKLGDWLSFPLLKLFDIWVSVIVFAGLIIGGLVIFWYLSRQPIQKEKPVLPVEAKEGLIKKIFSPKFRVDSIEPEVKEKPKQEAAPVEIMEKPAFSKVSYQTPPLNLLETDKGEPTFGDIKMTAAIIKKTLENFNIAVEMGGINTGPTVTQYTFKPAEGVKLSRITALSNNLSLALAAHPIRIEAPIPGKPLVGIEVPNKVRAQVRLKDLLSDAQFQNSPADLCFALGRDVAGQPAYGNIAKMPHLLVAGSTGSGKTIFLNSLILSLIYRNSPKILRLILIDPKRVEFVVYEGLPHLLSPVIFDAQRTINALKWLIGEMERRFDVLSEVHARDINSFNQIALREKKEPLPFIVFIIDELADIIAARGKEVEAGIVRLSQMARAVGIHLIVATQRPSVEVITGLIKANITARVTFQVASQVDSRTILDTAGAEKLLGFGDMLFLSAEIGKPRRLQGAYVSEKEVKKVINWLKSKNKLADLAEEAGISENHLAEDLAKTLEEPKVEIDSSFFGDDPFYEEAKRLVIEARKASASLLQRRLRIGYARAARLLDMLEEKGIVGPADGAKPREVYLPKPEETEDLENPQDSQDSEEDSGFKPI